ncbi:MAG: hypothetical protein HeimC2_27320 [Candidatus Heimdallarchaeota archaeon LC_2]|nr:MAG: hypothetical protein HeimC2_27320 [Candidatus Heimdallarchaeota archaeon LC_2]
MRHSLLILFFIPLLCISLLNPISAQNNDIMLYHSDLNLITTDGIVNQDEYPQTIAIWNYKNEFVFAHLSWAHNSTHLSIGIVAELTGFIAFGMNSEEYSGNAMTGANMIIASIVGNDLTIGDYHAIGQQAPIIDDDEYDSLQLAHGREQNGVTSVEFMIPLASSDTDDITWQVNNQYTFFLAGSKDSDLLTYHENYHTSPYSFTITDDSIEADENLITLGASSSGIEIPYDEVLYVTIFFVGIIFFMRRNRLTARY